MFYIIMCLHLNTVILHFYWIVPTLVERLLVLCVMDVRDRDIIIYGYTMLVEIIN